MHLYFFSIHFPGMICSWFLGLTSSLPLSVSLFLSDLGPGGLCLHSVAEFPGPHCWLPSPEPLLGQQQGAVGLHFQMDQRLLHGADRGCHLSQVLTHY